MIPLYDIHQAALELEIGVQWLQKLSRSTRIGTITRGRYQYSLEEIELLRAELERRRAKKRAWGRGLRAIALAKKEEV